MKNKKKVLLLAGMVLVAVVGVLGYQAYEAGERKLAEEAKRIEAEEKEKAEAQKAAEEEQKRLEEIKAHLAAEEAQKAREKAAEEAKKKEEEDRELAEQKPAAEPEPEKAEVIVTQPQTVAPLTMTGSKNVVTEKANVIEPKQPENKVEPKPEVVTPTEDVKQHYEAERKAEEAAKTDPAAPPVNQSGNGIAASDSPDNPFNHLQYSDVPPVYDETTMTDGSKYSTHEPGTGEKF